MQPSVAQELQLNWQRTTHMTIREQHSEYVCKVPFLQVMPGVEQWWWVRGWASSMLGGTLAPTPTQCLPLEPSLLPQPWQSVGGEFALPPPMGYGMFRCSQLTNGARQLPVFPPFPQLLSGCWLERNATVQSCGELKANIYFYFHSSFAVISAGCVAFFFFASLASVSTCLIKVWAVQSSAPSSFLCCNLCTFF